MRFKLRSNRGLKGGLPQCRGLEVKSVSFRIEPTGHSDSGPTALLTDVVKNWLEVETRCQVEVLHKTMSRKLIFENSDGKVVANVILDNKITDDRGIFEIQSINPFFRGVETTRIRIVSREKQTHLQVSSFMDSKDSTRPIHEIPRLGDSLVAELLRISELKFSIDGVEISTRPQQVDASNARTSELANANERHLLPLIGFPSNALGIDTAERVAFEAAGLAVTLLVSVDLFGSTHRSFFVYWRDGSKVEWHQSSSDLHRVLRQVHLRGLRSETFATTWRMAQNLWPKGLPENRSSATSATHDELELLETRARLEEALRVISEITLERDSFIAEFDETQKRWKRSLEEAQKKNARLFASRTRQDLDPQDFQLHPILSGSGLEAILAELTATTQGAIVFTERVARSWHEAQKRGYGKPEPMEEALEKLCRFAIAYRLANGALGTSRKQFAKRFGLELVEADDKLPNKFFNFQGKSYSQEPHIRADQKNATFDTLGRIHFDFDQENTRIVVNHMGGKQWKNDK